jgi:hypothetical protein
LFDPSIPPHCRRGLSRDQDHRSIGDRHPGDLGPVIGVEYVTVNPPRMHGAPRHSPTVTFNSNPDDDGQGRALAGDDAEKPMIHGPIRRQRR